MSFAIEKSIPIPEVFSPNKYPFKEMEIGDSFLVPEQGHKAYTRLRNSANSCSQRSEGKLKFTVRLVKEGVRVWRVG